MSINANVPDLHLACEFELELDNFTDTKSPLAYLLSPESENIELASAL